MNLTKDELYEVNDAINEVIHRMLTKGQTPIEVKLRALANLWRAWTKVTEELLGTADTPGLKAIAPKVMDAIHHPKTLRENEDGNGHH